MKKKELRVIRKRIQKLRFDRGLSQQRVADYLDVSQNAYHKIENGHTKLQVVTLLVLSDLFEISIHDFFKDL